MVTESAHPNFCSSECAGHVSVSIEDLDGAFLGVNGGNPEERHPYENDTYPLIIALGGGLCAKGAGSP